MTAIGRPAGPVLVLVALGLVAWVATVDELVRYLANRRADGRA